MSYLTSINNFIKYLAVQVTIMKFPYNSENSYKLKLNYIIGYSISYFTFILKELLEYITYLYSSRKD